MSDRIGFIGLGNMGRPMAGQLIAKGYDTTVFDLAEAPMEILHQAGAKRADSIPDLVAACDIVVTMLPNTPDVQAVVLGEGGLLATGRPGMMHIDMSTIDPLASKAMPPPWRPRASAGSMPASAALPPMPTAATAASWSAPPTSTTPVPNRCWRRWAKPSCIAAARVPASR